MRGPFASVRLRRRARLLLLARGMLPSLRGMAGLLRNIASVHDIAASAHASPIHSDPEDTSIAVVRGRRLWRRRRRRRSSPRSSAA